MEHYSIIWKFINKIRSFLKEKLKGDFKNGI